jgi:hypothetical protein
MASRRCKRPWRGRGWCAIRRRPGETWLHQETRRYATIPGAVLFALDDYGDAIRSRFWSYSESQGFNMHTDVRCGPGFGFLFGASAR